MNSGMSLNETLISYLDVKIPRVSTEGMFHGMRYTYTYIGPLRQSVIYFISLRNKPENVILKILLSQKYAND